MNKERRKIKPSQIKCLKYEDLSRPLRASIRFVSGRDFRQISAIEHDSFEYPWSYHDFYSKLSEDGVLCYVVECGESIVAYAIVKYHSRYIELCNLAVDSKYRRNKVASMIINMLKMKLYAENKRYIITYISEYNLAAQLFLCKNGFIAQKVLRNYYVQGYSAYRMIFKHKMV